MRSWSRINGGAIAAAILLFVVSNANAAAWMKGEFMSGGKPVQEYHCVPAGKGPFPAVVILHGATPQKDAFAADFQKTCTDLAALGYYAEFPEYYSQTEPVDAEQRDKIRENFPVWLIEIHSALDALDKNPEVDPHRVALMGFSLGSFLALSTGAIDPSQVDAIVEYYGGLPANLQGGAATMPPVLILHGDQDVLVPVSMAHTLDALLTKNNRPHEMKIYPGANHAFNVAELAFWYNADDANDAWNRSVKFLAEYLKNGGSAGAAASK